MGGGLHGSLRSHGCAQIPTICFALVLLIPSSGHCETSAICSALVVKTTMHSLPSIQCWKTALAALDWCQPFRTWASACAGRRAISPPYSVQTSLRRSRWVLAAGSCGGRGGGGGGAAAGGGAPHSADLDAFPWRSGSGCTAASSRPTSTANSASSTAPRRRPGRRCRLGSRACNWRR